MNLDLLAYSNRNCFIESLNQEFLATRGYGAFAYHSQNSILMIYNQYLNQDQSEQEFIKRVARHPLIGR
jgi:hypothetical protein